MTEERALVLALAKVVHRKDRRSPAIPKQQDAPSGMGVLSLPTVLSGSAIVCGLLIGIALWPGKADHTTTHPIAVSSPPFVRLIEKQTVSTPADEEELVDSDYAGFLIVNRTQPELPESNSSQDTR
ncbi:MAG: hypothetical protein KDN22_25585 [Verrucomicrobiae bacterium]|nr:hypothetical protein [Verrucomicrobiae bacterium]